LKNWYILIGYHASFNAATTPSNSERRIENIDENRYEKDMRRKKYNKFHILDVGH
jgi:hypothetical protein